MEDISKEYISEVDIYEEAISEEDISEVGKLLLVICTLLIFTVKVQWKNCISHQITAFKLHLDCSSINSKIEEKSYKTLIFLQPKYCYWINVKIIFKNCKV